METYLRDIYGEKSKSVQFHHLNTPTDDMDEGSFGFGWHLSSEEMYGLVCDTTVVWRLKASWEAVSNVQESLSPFKISLILTNREY